MTRKFFQKVAAIAMVLATLSLGAFAQNRSIHGTVVDGAGVPVIGATVMVVGNSNIGTVTDVDGAFTLNVPANANISVSCIGYTTQTVAVGQQSEFSFILSEDSEFLEETVVIGYGVQKKSDLTGAVASVRSDDLQNRSTTDAAAALQGKAAGVQIINTSGAPGSGASIRVRGYSSNSGNIGPLLIVDGLKVDNIQYLDPEMIESMEVLKDAASAAIYGAEAGNGVVLITTKKGENGTAHITYNGKFTMQSLAKHAELLNAAEYIEYQKASSASFTDELLKTNGYTGIDNNWMDTVFAPSWSQQHAITFQGGNNKGHFFLSLNSLKNDGIVRGEKDLYKRLTAQINADYQLFNWFNVSTSNTIEKWDRSSVSEAAYGSFLNSVMSLDPLTPAYYSTIEECSPTLRSHYYDGDPVRRDPNHNNDFYATSRFVEESTGNPLFQRDRTDSSNGGINLRGNLTGNFTPFKWLTVTSRLGYIISQSSSHSYSEPYWLTSMCSDNKYSISANVSNSLYYQWENFANFNKTWGKHNVNAMVGMSFIHSENDSASISASDTDILKAYAPNFRYISSLLDKVTKTVSNAPGESASISYFGRIGYSYDSRYYVQANFRADAFDSSKLAKQSRWGYFPSASIGWTISNESFFKDNISRSAVSLLKLRASWGRNGNVNILNNYPYAATISLNDQWYQYNPSAGTGVNTLGSGPTDMANPELKWETSEQWDAGLDGRFLNDRLSFGFDWYRKETKDLLLSYAPTPELGVKSVTSNAGNVLNSGLEFELGWKDSVGDFHYSINANFSTLHNEVLELHDQVDHIDGTVGGVSGLNNKVRTRFSVGQPIWYFYAYKYAGVNSEGAPQYYNAEGEIVDAVTESDMQYIGKGIPDATYGITINLEYKGFDFSVFGTGSIGNDVFSLLYSADRPRTNCMSYYWKNSWNNPNAASKKYPSSDKVYNDWTYWSSSASLFDGSYFKIKQIQLGYTLPQYLTKKAYISDLRLFVSLDDFFTITKYPGFDPETAATNSSNGRGYDSGNYPTTKKLVLGINLTF